MKVCQIMFSGLGGHGSVVFSLINAAQQQWQHSIIFIGNEDVKSDYLDYCHKKNIQQSFVDIRLFSRLKGWLKVYQDLKHMRPEHVILHSLSYIVPVMIYCLVNRIPLTTVEHTPSNKKRKVDFLFSKLSHLGSDHIVLLTRNFANDLKRKIKWFYKPQKVHIIGNGVDVNVFNQVDLKDRQIKHDSQVLRIGMAARFSHEKLQGLLIDAFDRLCQNGVDNVELSLAGSGETFEYNKEKVQTLTCRNRIHFEGMLGEQELIHWFQGLDIYIHASSSETMCTTVLQGLACSKPIIASDIAGINDVLVSDSAILVKNEAQAFCNAIMSLLNDDDKREIMGTLGRKYCLENYSNTAMFNQYNKLVKVND